MGLSRREFSRREGCSEGAVRNALRQGRLAALPDGTLDPAQLGGGWFRNFGADRKRRVKRETYAAQLAQTAQFCAEIPTDVAHFYGWDDADHSQDVTEGLSILLLSNSPLRDDVESTGHAIIGHGTSLLQREAYKLGWREDAKYDAADGDPVGPGEYASSLTAQPLTFGLVRALGRALKAGADPEEAEEFDISDPVGVATQMLYLAGEIIEQDLKRRRRAAGIISLRDKRHGQ